MSNGISFEEARTSDIPLIGVDGNVLFEQRARLSSTEPLFARRVANSDHQAVDGCW